MPTTRSAAFDWFNAVSGLWLIAGLFSDLGWHMRQDVDSFLTPAHAMLYSGLLLLIVGTVAYRVRAGMLPPGYELAPLGLGLFFAGGVLDFINHALWGFESGFLALLSPTHLVIGVGILILLAGPIRSALAVPPAPTLRGQLPAVLALASILELLHWATNFIFLAGAEMQLAPYFDKQMTPDTLTEITIAYYKQAQGVMAFLLQSLLMVGSALYMLRVATLRQAQGDTRSAQGDTSLKPGAFTILFVLGNSFIALGESTSWAQA
ncbi:MAG: hypothetical protein JOZ38_07415, partial [Candidatus Eremiobacteraeota bacterium]|nr:hypothetical protein [Candidatus Eremiobacteraeota bacterium]